MKVTTSKGNAYLKLEGDMTVARAAAFKNALINAIGEGDSIVIDLGEVNRIDLACMQLLCSAHRTAANSGKKLTVKDPSLPVYQEARKNAGFMYSKPCRYVSAGDCLWIGGNE